jgi:hypothetical protein
MTAELYASKLEELERLAPKNLLLDKLKQGTGIVNNVLLAIELKKAREEAIEEPGDPIGDDRLKAMRVELRKLFSDRAALSNKFHDCKTNADRAVVSEDIQVVQRNIERVMGWIRQYIVHGTLPDEAERKYYVPKDGLELAKKRNSLRASISRKKKEVERLRQGDLSSPALARKVESEENKLTDLKMQLANVEEAIDHLH